MPKEITLRLSPKQAADKNTYIPLAAKEAGVDASRVAFASIVRRSVDARRGAVKVELAVRLYIDEEPAPPPVHFDYPDVSRAPEVVVVGGGPAGLFAALRLIERGLRPVILERGREVSPRKRDIARINRNQGVDPDSNYAFGEGGAGTFSDGKLFTRSKKRGDYDKALRTFVFHGADPEILYDARPHIGSDRLPRIITNIRKTITDAGGTFLFSARVSDIIIKDGAAAGVEWTRAAGGENTGPGADAGNPGDAAPASGGRIEAAAVILATGHSADDIYELLHRKGLHLEAKPFAAGLRIEHPQKLIDSIQYRMPERDEYLPAAAYSLVSQVGGRGVYSFCMCPGGFIVPAMTDPTEGVVNGMSPSERNSPYANSGIVTEIRLSDFAHLTEEHGPLAGLRFRQGLEHAARAAAGEGQTAPAQRVADFAAGRSSGTLPRCSYVPGTTATEFDKWLPRFMADALRGGISEFGRKMRGFVTNEAVLLGVESRTSTPVRIPRDPDTLQHPQTAGLYPAGEGAGYAGGIISAAIDGHRIADAVAGTIKYKR